MPRPRKVTPSKEAPKEPLPTLEELFSRAKQFAVDEAYGDAIHTAAETSKLVSDISALLAKVDPQIGKNAIAILSDLLEIEDASEAEENDSGISIKEILKASLPAILSLLNGSRTPPLPQTECLSDYCERCSNDCIREMLLCRIAILSKEHDAVLGLNHLVDILHGAIEVANKNIKLIEERHETSKPTGKTVVTAESPITE